MRLIDKRDEVIGKEIVERVGRRAGHDASSMGSNGAGDGDASHEGDRLLRSYAFGSGLS